jgi:nitrate/nitrite-specific signal transduction histidine kinase
MNTQKTATGVGEDFIKIVASGGEDMRESTQDAEMAVELNEEGEHYTLSVIDNGRGFQGSPSTLSTRMGLGTIRYRARLLGATCDINSKPGEGTVVRCSLPLHHAVTH